MRDSQPECLQMVPTIYYGSWPALSGAHSTSPAYFKDSGERGRLDSDFASPGLASGGV